MGELVQLYVKGYINGSRPKIVAWKNAQTGKVHYYHNGRTIFATPVTVSAFIEEGK
jgi:hypothetical protein